MEIDKMKAVLSDFEERMRKLENPGSQRQSDQDPENNFINLMREINAGGQADQAEDGGTDEDQFIADLVKMNRQTADNQE